MKEYLVLECKECGHKGLYLNGNSDGMMCAKCGSGRYIPIDSGGKKQMLKKHNINPNLPTNKFILKRNDFRQEMAKAERDIQLYLKENNTVIDSVKIDYFGIQFNYKNGSIRMFFDNKKFDYTGTELDLKGLRTVIYILDCFIYHKNLYG